MILKVDESAAALSTFTLLSNHIFSVSKPFSSPQMEILRPLATNPYSLQGPGNLLSGSMDLLLLNIVYKQI